MNNPKVYILEDLLGLEHNDKDSLMLSFYNGKFSCSYIDFENDSLKVNNEESIELNDVSSIIAFNFCTGLNLINDMEGTQFLYDSKYHRKVLSFSIIVPLCKGQVLYNDELKFIEFSKTFEDMIRRSFKVED